MPRAKNIELSALMQKAERLHASLIRCTAEYNKVIAQAQLLQKVQEDVRQGDHVYVGNDYCQVLLKKVVAGACQLRLLRKCNEPEAAYISTVRDFEITRLDEVTEIETDES